MPTIGPLYGWYPYYYPIGGPNYACGAIFNGGQYCNPKMDRLIQKAIHATGDSALPALYNVENYVADQIPTLWVPTGPYQISVIKKQLHIPLPQGMMTNIYPQLWTWKEK